MPRQNRVTPFSDLVAVAARGALMGNRGVLHDAAGRIVRRHTGRRWILCVLSFKGRRREVMSPGRYTELFFLDEATGLAAGHRPCAECQRGRFNDFRRRWAVANPDLAAGAAMPSAEVIDRALHAERLTPDGRQRTHEADLAGLPAGVIIQYPGPGQACLVLAGGLAPWSPEGYGAALPRPVEGRVTVLTPRSVVRALAAGGW